MTGTLFVFTVNLIGAVIIEGIEKLAALGCWYFCLVF